MDPLATGGLLLALRAGQPRTVDELARACHTTPLATAQVLHRLAAQGVVVSDGAATPPRYRLAGAASAGIPDPSYVPRILLVDDDTGIVEFMSFLLEAEGYHIVAVRTPSDGMHLLAAVSFDLVVTDGFSRTAAGIRTTTAGVVWVAGWTPVVLFTTHLLHRDLVQALGFRALIPKPFDLDGLLAQVHALLPAPNSTSPAASLSSALQRCAQRRQARSDQSGRISVHQGDRSASQRVSAAGRRVACVGALRARPPDSR